MSSSPTHLEETSNECRDWSLGGTLRSFSKMRLLYHIIPHESIVLLIVSNGRGIRTSKVEAEINQLSQSLKQLLCQVID